jgi:hypothetical protein
MNITIFLSLTLLAAPAAQVLYEDSFDGNAFDPGWTVDASTGNEVRLEGGAAAFYADENTYAHLERALGLVLSEAEGVDCVTVSARIKPAPAVSWCTSLFLYWDPGNWCQMGVIWRDGGRYYTTQMVNGAYTEADLASCEFDHWHFLRLELGRDCLRALAVGAGVPASPLQQAVGAGVPASPLQQIIPRPAEFSGPPQLLIVGKGYSRGVEPYARPDLDNDFPTRGGRGVSYVDDVVVTPTPADRLNATPEERCVWERADRDARGEEELARPGDPSFATVARHFPPLKHSREVVGVPEHAVDIGVSEDGRLEFEGRVATFQVGQPPVPFASVRERTHKRLLGGSLPIVVTTFTHDGLEYEQTVFGYTAGFRPDGDLWAYVRMRVRNPCLTPWATSVAVSFQPEGTPPQSWPLTVSAHGSAQVCLRFPYDPKLVVSHESGADGTNVPDYKPVEVIKTGEFDEKWAQTEQFWQEWLGQGMQVEVPEPRVQEAWRAWRAYSFLDVDRRGELYEPHDGAGFYEAIFGYSAALYAHALDLWGYPAHAARYLDTLIHHQQPDGLYTENFGLPDNGALLFALAQHHRLTGDDDHLRRVAPAMQAAAHWVIQRRQESHRAAAENDVTYGLIRFRPYCDYGEPTVDYFGEVYNCVGLEETAAAFRRIGRTDEARRLEEEAKSYRRDIVASMDRAVVQKDGMSLLPMEPDTHRLLKAESYRAGGYYGLVASCFLEIQFLPPRDPRIYWVTDALERRRGLILGLSEFARGVDHAYTYGYLLTQLRRDEVRRVLLGFYGMLAYGMSRGTYSGVECTQITTGENALTLPHLYSCTQQLRLLRMLLLREEGDDLLLAYAIPRSWLANGQRVAVRRAPTAFGPASFAITSHVDAGRITVRVEPPMRKTPRSVRVRLRHPTRAHIARVTVNGRRWTSWSGEVIDLGPLRGPAEVQVRYAQ